MRGPPSFRARIFAVTALIVVTVLAAVVALGWSSVFAYEVQRLDERLCGEVRRLTVMPPPRAGTAPRWLEDDLVAKLRLKSPAQLLWWLARDGDGAPLSERSARWPAELEPARLDWRPLAGAPAPERARIGPPAGLPEGLPDGPPGGPPGGPPAGPACRLAAFELGGAAWHAARVELPWSQALVAVDTAAIRAEMQGALQRAAVFALPLALLLTGAGAWLLSALALRPVTRLAEAMKTVDEKALDRRLQSDGEAREFRALIAAYNTMLARLEASFHQASRFSADAAHELKTPLTILRGQLERALEESEQHPVQARLAPLLEEVGRLASITRKLLLLSQADAGRLALRLQPLDLGALLADCAADCLTDAEGADPAPRLQCDLPPGLRLQGDEQLLRQLLNNLCRNALRYAPPGSRVRLEGRAQAQTLELRFENRAPGLMPADRARFFERFFRGDAAHGRQLDGHGLGLSLSRVIAVAHGGALVLEEAIPGDDTVVLRLTLPRGGPGAGTAAGR